MHVDNSSAPVARSFIQRWMWVAFAFLIVAASAASALLLPFPAQANVVTEKLTEIMATILSSFVFILGKILLLAIFLLTIVAQYNKFIDAAAVINGWVIVRDLANMFFIVVLLIIAFATILNVSSYQWKAMLPQLLIAAILINFSKTIAGILIDISQVVTLTFVNGFAAAAAGNFGQMFQIQGLLTLNPPAPGQPPPPLDLLKILGSFFLAMVLLIIAIVITFIMTAIFTFRIVMLWALVVLSPLPYLLRVIPQGQKYSQKWWSMFGEYLTIGPVLAFFLWLALVSVGTGTVGAEIRSGAPVGGSAADGDALSGATGAIPTAAATPDAMLSFVVAIAMLIAGMKIAGEMGVMGAGALKNAQAKMGDVAKWGAKKFTGYRYASERVGAAWQMHETARKEKAQAGGAALYQGIGTALSLPGRGIDALKGKIPENLRAKFAPLQARAAQARREAADLRKSGKPEDLAAAQKADARAKRWDRASTAAGYAWKAGMVAAAPVTGGFSALGLAPAAIRQAQKAGGAAQAAGRDYKHKEVRKALEGMTDMKEQEVRDVMDGKKPGVTSHERAAAFLHATKKGWLGSKEVAGGESFLESLGADKKTVSTFKAYADERGLGLSKDDRKRRIEAGTMPTKDLSAKEFSEDGGALAAEFVLSGTSNQRKELGQSRTQKEGYRKGLQDALGNKDLQLSPQDRLKIQGELMRLGKAPEQKDEKTQAVVRPAQSALASSGMGPGDLQAALKDPGMASDVLTNLTAEELGRDDIVQEISGGVSAATLSAAIGAAKKSGEGGQLQALQAVVAQIQKTTQYQAYDTARSPVRGATTLVGSTTKKLESERAKLGTLTGGTPEHTAAERRVSDLDGQLTAAKTALKKANENFEEAIKDLDQQKRDLFDGFQDKRFRVV